MPPKAFAYIGVSTVRSAHGQLDCIEGGRPATATRNDILESFMRHSGGKA